MFKVFYSCLLVYLLVDFSNIAMETQNNLEVKPDSIISSPQQNNTTTHSSNNSQEGETIFDKEKIEKLNTIFQKYSLGLGQKLNNFLNENHDYNKDLNQMAEKYFYEKMKRPDLNQVFLAEVFPFLGWVQGNITMGSGECDYLVITLQKHIPQAQRVGYMTYLQNLLAKQAQENLSLGYIVNKARILFLREQNKGKEDIKSSLINF